MVHHILIILLAIPAAASVQTSPLDTFFTSFEKELNGTRDMFEKIYSTSSCIYNTACDIPTPHGRYNSTFQHVSSYPIPVSFDRVVFKKVVNQEPLDQICTFFSMNEFLQNSIITDPTIVWQSFGSSQTYGEYPAVDWESLGMCGPFSPNTRPWYTAAISSQKNIIIMLDFSNDISKRFNTMINTAVGLIEALTFQDFFSIITYSEIATPYSTNLLQATSDNKQNVVNWLNSLNLPIDGKKANIGAYSSALTMLEESFRDGTRTLCNNFTVILSSGIANVSSPRPTEVVATSRESHMKVVVYAINTDHVDDDVKQLPCRTEGYLKRITNSTTAVTLFQEYLMSNTNITSVKFLQVYTDIFGINGTITSAVPVYNNGRFIGVVSMDKHIYPLTDRGYTIDEINAYILGRQTCERFITNKTFIELVSEVHECPPESNIIPTEKPTLVKYKWAILGTCIAVTFLIAICLTFLPAIFENHQLCRNYGIGVTIALCIAIGLWIVFWPIYTDSIYDSQIKETYWKKSIAITLDKKVYKEQCTDIRNCACWEYPGESCSNAANDITVPGSMSWRKTCSTGYYCCREDCDCLVWQTDCDDDDDWSGSRCTTYCAQWYCYCAVEVYHRKCEVVRGICETVIFEIENQTPDGSTTTFSQISCGLNDTNCVNSFENEWMPIGRKQDMYYNPWNPTEITKSIGFNHIALGFFITVCICLAIIYIGSAIFAMRVCTESRKPPAYSPIGNHGYSQSKYGTY